MRRLAFVSASLLASAGCHQKVNDQYCEGHSMDQEHCSVVIDGPIDTHCKVDNDCAKVPSTPVCDTAKDGGTCEQCATGHETACTGDAPVCDTTTDTCHGCVTDADCADGAATGVCLPSGACAAQTAILHVTTNGNGAADCSATAPCKIDVALTSLSATKNVLKFDGGGSYQPMGGFAFVNDVTVDARTTTQTVLGRKDAGPVVSFDDSRKVTILGGEVAGATGAGADGIRCTDSTLTSGPTGAFTLIGGLIDSNNESAIESDDCNITLTQTIIKNNSTNSASTANVALKISNGSLTISQSIVNNNRAGGLSASGTTKITVVGNLFRENGDTNSNTSGVFLNISSTGNRFDFNTITQNKTQGSNVSGANCSAPADFIPRNNIVAQNTGNVQISTGCLYEYSIIQQAGATGTGVSTGDPMFVSGSDAHLQSGSPARNAAKPGSDLTGLAAKDIDGKPRNAGGGNNAADVGAYVFPTP